MLTRLRRMTERTLIGDSVPALVRWGRAAPRRAVQRLREDGFREVVRYTAQHQKFFSRKLTESGIDAESVRGPDDLGNIFTTPEDLLSLPAAATLTENAAATILESGAPPVTNTESQPSPTPDAPPSNTDTTADDDAAYGGAPIGPAANEQPSA